MLTIIKGKIDSNTIIVGDFNTPLTPMNRSSRKKINKEIQTLNDTMDQLDLVDIYRIFHPKTMNFTFFSSTHGTLSRIDHILDHKSSFGKFKKKNWNHSKHLFWSQCGKMWTTGEKKTFKTQTHGGWTTRCWITNKSQKKSKTKSKFA